MAAAAFGGFLAQMGVVEGKDVLGAGQIIPPVLTVLALFGIFMALLMACRLFDVFVAWTSGHSNQST